jgi:hypothetical protein
MEPTRTVLAVADPDLRRYVLPYVAEAYQIAGINIPDSDTLDFTVKKFCFVLKTKFKNVPQDYISKYLNAGAWGEYGEFKSISVKTLVHWMQSGVSHSTAAIKAPTDNCTIEQKARTLFARMKEEAPAQYEEMMQSLDKMIQKNAQVRQIRSS